MGSRRAFLSVDSCHACRGQPIHAVSRVPTLRFHRVLPFHTALLLATGLLFATVLSPHAVLAQEVDEAVEPMPEGPPPRAYIIAVPMSAELETHAARVGAAARVALRGVTTVDAEGPDQAFLGYSDFMLERLRRARQRLDDGREAYLELEIEQAIDLLMGAVEDFESAASALEDPSDMGEALLYLGASQVFAGHNRGARSTFARLHTQMPHLSPDPNVFNPDVVSGYERATPRDRRRPRGSVTVVSEPEGAIIYLDYLARGRTPMTIDGLLSGVHTVRVTRPGATPFVEQVELNRRGREVNVFLEDNEATPQLAEALARIAEADVSSMGPDGPIAEVAHALEVDKLGVIRVADGESDEQVQLELLMFDVETGERLLRMYGPVPIAHGQLEAGVQQLVSGSIETALRPRSEQAVDGESIPARRVLRRIPPREPEVYERWWFWAGVGVAVAATVVATVAWTSAGDDLGTDPSGQVVLEF